MPARLYFSNSLDALVDRLIRGLDGADPFVAPSIATPTPALRGWLQIRLAERLGIAANIDFPHLEKLLWDRLAQLDLFRDVEERQPARLLDAMSFQGLILTWLRKTPPAALQRYLSPEDAEPYDEARRLCQLAGRLAALFREYEYSRVSEGGFRGLAETWSRGEACFEQYLRGAKFSARQREQIRELEAWQREIYQALFREKGLRDQWGEASGVYRYTLPQYAERVLSQQRAPGKAHGDSRVFHLFGLSNISPFHRALIHRLADAEKLGSDAALFEIYALNPCAEYWEDATSPQRRLSEAELQAEELPDDSEENALLARFGKPGRETLKLWNQITDYDFFGDFREPENNTLLATVQRAVLHRGGPLSGDQRRDQDSSLQVWSAPDRHAEVEAAKAHIGELLLANASLKLEDIAVIPADFEAYLPIIESVFTSSANGRKEEAGFVPHCLPEAGMLRESPLLRGFRDLLELGAGSFRRGALLSWLENPAVQKRLRLNAALIASFAKFLEAAGFQEGWNEEHGQWREAVPGDLSTAEAATQRVLLGLILDPSDPALEGAGLHPAANAGWDREELSQCLELLDRLREDLRPFRSGEALSFEAWSQHLRLLLEGYFEADPEQPLEIQAEKDLRRFCADLEQWDSRERVSIGPQNGVTHHVISVLLEDHFREPRAVRVPFLTGGVRIGSLSALRSLPFRHVYLLGFNAGEFPAPREASPLDLRGYRRVIGEADPASRDLYAFLEVLCTVSERAILSYVRRDAARDSVRQPSQALAGLMAYLESDVLTESGEKSAAFSVLELNAEGRHETDPAIDAKALEKWQPSPRPQLETLRLRALENFSGAETADWMKSRFAPPQRASLLQAERAEKPVWDLQNLAAYLQNPAEQAVFNHFRFPTSLEAAKADEASPLFLSRWEIQRFLDPALRAEWLQTGQGESAARMALQQNIWSGKGPPQPYADLELERVEEEARNFIENSLQELREATDALGLRFAGTLRLGGQGTRPLDPPFLDHPAFDASPLGVNARITGILPLFFAGKTPDAGWGVLLGSRDREQTAAYVFHLCVAALDDGRNFAGPGYVLFSESGEGFGLPLLDPQKAGGDLRALLEDILRAPDFDHLPLSEIEKIAGRSVSDTGSDRVAWKEKIEAREREEEESPFAPSTRRTRILRALGPEVPADAESKIERRVLPFLRWREQWKEITP